MAAGEQIMMPKPDGNPKHFCTDANQISADLKSNRIPAMEDVASTAIRCPGLFFRIPWMILLLTCVPFDVSFCVRQMMALVPFSLIVSAWSSVSRSKGFDLAPDFILLVYSYHFCPKEPLKRW